MGRDLDGLGGVLERVAKALCAQVGEAAVGVQHRRAAVQFDGARVERDGLHVVLFCIPKESRLVSKRGGGKLGWPRGSVLFRQCTATRGVPPPNPCNQGLNTNLLTFEAVVRLFLETLGPGQVVGQTAVDRGVIAGAVLHGAIQSVCVCVRREPEVVSKKTNSHQV